MASVDNRIVSMEMRNQQFEQNAKTSMKTIEALDTSLKTLSNAKGLDKIDTTNVTSSLGNISKGVDAIVSSFTLLGNIGVKVLNDIASVAYNTGKNLASAFTVEPIFTGFQEYETQINAIQTILSNTRKDGTTLEQVNNALDELNHYADMTIYNFTEMTRNIGTFTAAGVDLDTSVSAIKGISNLAAISGSTSAQASRAMYQLSQAIAAGTVNLQDWNSVVNAGMGGQIFQDALKETAHLMGLVTEAEPGQSFRESISSQGGTGWLTSEVLLETLKKFTGDMTEAELMAKGYTAQQAKDIVAMGIDAQHAATKVKTLTQLMDTLKEAAQSGWTQSWEIIIGDFEEAKTALTAVSDTFSEVIGSSAEARNAVLQDWKDLGGRDLLFEGFKNIYETIMQYVTMISTAFSNVFPPTTGATLANITKKFTDFTKSLKPNVQQMQKLRETFTGFFSLLNIGKKLLSATFQIISPIFGEFNGLGDAILTVTSALGRYITKLDETIFSSENFNEVIKGGKAIVSGFIDLFKGGIKQLSPVGDFFKGVFESLKNSTVGKGVTDFFNSLTSGAKIKIDPEKIKEAFTEVKQIFADLKKNINFSDIANHVSEKFKDMGFTLENFKATMSDVLNFFKELKDKIADTLGSFGDRLGQTKKDVSETKNIFTAKDIKSVINTGFLGVLVVSIKKLFGSLTETFEGTHSILDNIAGTIEQLGGVLKAYSNDLNANALLKIAGAIAILAAALAGLAFVPFEQLANVTVLLTLVGAALLGFFKVFSKIKASLGDSKKKSSGLDLKGIIGDIVAPFTGVIKAFQTKIKMEAISTIASTLFKFVAAIGVLALIPADRLKDSVIAMGAAAAELATAVAIMSLAAKNTKGTSFAGMALTLVGLGMAISTISKTMSSLKDLNAEQLTKSMTVLATLMLFMAMFVKALDGVKSGLGNVATIVAVTAAIAALSAVMALLGQVQWETIGKGLAGIVGVLASLTIAVNLMNGTVSGAASMIVVAGALAILIPELAILGNMKPQTIAIGLIALAGAFAVIGGAAYLITPIAPALMAFSAALAGIVVPIGLVILAIAQLVASFEGFANGLVTISSMSNEQIQSTITNLTTMINGFLTLLPQMQTAVASIMTAIIGAIVQALVLAANDIASGLVVLLTSVLELLARYAQPITSSVLLIIIGILTAMRDHIGDFVIVLMQTLDEILLALGEAAGPFLDSCIKFLVGVIDGLADALINNAGPLADAIIKLVDSLIYVLIEAVKAGIHALFGPAEMIADALLGGLRDGLDSHSPSRETESIGGDAMDGLGIGIDENDSPTKAATSKIEELLGQMGDKTASFAGVGREQAQEYGKGFEESFSLSSYLEKGTSDILGSLDSQKTSYGTSGESLGTEFGDKLAAAVGAQAPEAAKSGNEVLTALTTSGLDTITNSEKDFQEAGSQAILRLTDGMSREEDQVLRTIGDIMRSAVNKTNEYYDQFLRAGEQAMEGLAYGIKANGYEAIKSAQAVAKQALKAAKEELEIQSPSRAFRRVGEMADAGFAGGLLAFSGVVQDASKDVGKDSLEAVQESLQHISDVGLSDMYEDPVITPVLDLSQVEAGAGQIDSMMSQTRTLSLGSLSTSNILANLGSISGAMRAKAEPQVQTQTSDPKLLDLMTRLDTRLTQLGDEITHLQVVMDTGALVGEISGPLDRNLGWKTTLRNRGV